MGEVIKELEPVGQAVICVCDLMHASHRVPTCVTSAESYKTAMSAKLNKLTVPELRKQLVTSGLPVTGRKADLVQRLREVEKGNGIILNKCVTLLRLCRSIRGSRFCWWWKWGQAVED